MQVYNCLVFTFMYAATCMRSGVYVYTTCCFNHLRFCRLFPGINLGWTISFPPEKKHRTGLLTALSPNQKCQSTQGSWLSGEMLLYTHLCDRYIYALALKWFFVSVDVILPDFVHFPDKLYLVTSTLQICENVHERWSVQQLLLQVWLECVRYIYIYIVFIVKLF